jgi:hypothetical protein
MHWPVQIYIWPVQKHFQLQYIYWFAQRNTLLAAPVGSRTVDFVVFPLTVLHSLNCSAQHCVQCYIRYQFAQYIWVYIYTLPKICNSIRIDQYPALLSVSSSFTDKYVWTVWYIYRYRSGLFFTASNIYLDCSEESKRARCLSEKFSRVPVICLDSSIKFQIYV